MQIKKETKIVKEYILTEIEANLVKKCLQYCVHRLIKHREKGIHNVTTAQEVLELLNEYNK